MQQKPNPNSATRGNPAHSIKTHPKFKVIHFDLLSLSVRSKFNFIALSRLFRLGAVAKKLIAFCLGKYAHICMLLYVSVCWSARRHTFCVYISCTIHTAYVPVVGGKLAASATDCDRLRLFGPQDCVAINHRTKRIVRVLPPKYRRSGI